MPECIYSANGLDRANELSEPFDFYSEEFENVGFETLPLSRQNCMDLFNFGVNVGYVPPYTMYKTQVDEAYGSFSTVEYGRTNSGFGTKTWYGDMLAWSAQRKDINKYVVDDKGFRSKSNFYVNPRVYDTLFALNYLGDIYTEPFLLAANFSVKALRPMSVLGLPIFG